MGRILAIDYGTRRTGIAVSDPMRIIAGGLETIQTAQLMPFLEEYLDREGVDEIVIGEPRQMDGTPSQTWPEIEKLATKIRERFPAVRVEFQDERFTSILAQRTIRQAGIKKMARRDKALVDRVSATIILQSYMARQ